MILPQNLIQMIEEIRTCHLDLILHGANEFRLLHFDDAWVLPKTTIKFKKVILLNTQLPSSIEFRVQAEPF